MEVPIGAYRMFYRTIGDPGSGIKSYSTKSRKRNTLSVDDTNDTRVGKSLSLCFNWWSKKQNNAIRCRNILGITVKVGDMVIPLNLRIVSKQGKGNTDRPSCCVALLKEVLDFFDAKKIDLRKYPITFDSWHGSSDFVETLTEIGFTNVLIHRKSNLLF